MALVHAWRWCMHVHTYAHKLCFCWVFSVIVSGERTKRKWVMTQSVTRDQSKWSPENKRRKLDEGNFVLWPSCASIEWFYVG